VAALVVAGDQPVGITHAKLLGLSARDLPVVVGGPLDLNCARRFRPIDPTSSAAWC
jgi:hypothetical protein